MDCKICRFSTKSIVGLTQHLLRSHKIKLLDYKLKYEKFIIPNCICGNLVKINTTKGININESCGNSECIKSLQRNARLKFMKNNPEQTAWRLSNLSYPERLFKQKCEELNLHKHHLIIRERSVYPYFIDFAFENEKIAIEIDGTQHNLLERKEKDLKKDKCLLDNGWRIIRFTAHEIKFNIEFCFKELSNFLVNDNNYKIVGIFKNSELEKSLRKKKYFCKCGGEKSKKSSKFCFICSKKESRKVKVRPALDQLRIDVFEFGYLGAGRKYNVSDNAIRKWIKNYEKYSHIL